LHSAEIAASARRAGSDPGERRLEPLVAVFGRPQVERQRGQVVDFGDRAAVERQVDRLDVVGAVATGERASLPCVLGGRYGLSSNEFTPAGP
jgi:hypothetical protein